MEPIIEKISDLLRQKIGLSISSIGVPAISYAINTRMRCTDALTLDDYWRHLRSPIEFQALIEAIVVPETWFFRHQETFEGVKAYVLNDWLPKNLERPLRILSVPCSTGEEPYSIAMALLGMGFPAHRFVIDAVDISALALQRAKEGLYRRYSFRNDEVAFRDRYFAAEGESYRLSAEIISRVQFHEGNILELDILPLSDSYDVIFCRNLLIYLHEDSRQTAVAALANHLKSSGILFTSSAEATFFKGDLLSSTSHSKASSFQKVGNPSDAFSGSILSQAVPSQSAFRIPPVPPQLQPELQRSSPQVAVSLNRNASSSASFTASNAKPDLEIVTALANEGKFDEAKRQCEIYLEAYGDSAEAFFMMALISDALGDANSAKTYYRKVLYLDPNHLEALHHLASLLAVKGDEAGARQFQARAHRVVQRQV